MSEQLNQWFRILLRRPRPHALKARKAAFRPRVESLEERQAPAVFTVTSLSDSNSAGSGSLRAAISASNSTAGPNEIDILTAGVYRLTISGTDDTNVAGDLDILNNDVSILNKSGGAVVIDASGLAIPDRVIDVSPAGAAINVTIQGVTIQGGVATGTTGLVGGGIRMQNGSTLTLNNDVIQNNVATNSGGGVYAASGTISVNASTIQNNQAISQFGGGVTLDSGGTALNVTNSTISNNVANGEGGGISLIDFGTAHLTVTGGSISNNSLTNSSNGGGGIFVNSSGDVNITNCTISGNTSLLSGGGVEDAITNNNLTITNSTISNNHAAGGAGGGIDYELNKTVNIGYSVISGNSASTNGGGLAVNNAAATATILSSLFSGNRANGGNGGGIEVTAGTTLNAANATFTGNVASGNGGAFNIQTTGTGTTASNLINVTIVSNRSGSNGGGIDAPAAFTGSLTLLNDTITGNFTSNGGGLFWAGASGSTFTVQNTIIAQNIASPGPDANNPAGVFADSGGNLVGISGPGGGNVGFGNVTSQTGSTAAPLDPKLGALQNNGGQAIGTFSSPTTLSTEALLIGSPAHDRGVILGTPSTDERGSPRSDTVVAESPDVGAFESADPLANPAAFPLGASISGSTPIVNLTAGGALVISGVTPFPGFSGEIRRAAGDINRDGIPDIIWGAGPTGGPEVKVVDGKTGAILAAFFAFAPSFTGGIFVAAGDVNGDGVADIIVGAGAGGGPEVKVVDGTKLGMIQANGEIAPAALLGDFFAYSPTFTGGVTVAAGDVNGDRRADVITGAGSGGGPEVKVVDATKFGMVQANGQISAAALLGDFFAYNPAFLGGVYVSAGDVNGDGHADIVTGAGAGGGPEVKVIDGTKATSLQANGQIASSSLLEDFMAFDPGFLGGVRVDAVDVNGDGLADIVAGAGPGSEGHVKVFRALDLFLIDSFQPQGPAFNGGIYV